MTPLADPLGITGQPLAACSSGGHSDSEAPPTTARPSCATSDPLLYTPDPAHGAPAELTCAQRAAFLTAVRAISPQLAQRNTYSDRTLISSGILACAYRWGKLSAFDQLGSIISGFSTRTWVMTKPEAQKVIDVSRQYVCPDY